MPDIPASFIATAVTTFASGWMMALLTNTLNAHRSNNEKIWELRRCAYGSILAELARVELILDRADGYIEENELRYFHDETSNRNNSIISDNITQARKSYTDNYLILSDEFIHLFEAFAYSLDNMNQNLDPSDEHEEFAMAIREVRPRLLQQARSEMPLREGLWERIRRKTPWKRCA